MAPEAAAPLEGRSCPAGTPKAWFVVAAFATACIPTPASAQTDEIQVYDGGLSPAGIFNLTLHNNYVAHGDVAPAYGSAVTADKSWSGVPEWAVGVTSWFEAGLYLPLYTRDQRLGWGLDGFKLRALFATPHAEARRFVFGANFELSVNAERWDSSRVTSELRPIIGWRLGRLDVIVNPILDTAWDGLANLDFAPVARVALNFDAGWALALEQYSDFGPLGSPYAASGQSHQLYAVFDHRGAVEIEAGVGFGLTSASDKLTFKLILSRDLNGRRR
jgi:hypothetical protein